MRPTIVLSFLFLSACITEEIAEVRPTAETAPVASTDDAADDPAIWLHPDDPSKSLIIGTDKQAGLYVYGLDGEEKQFLPAGRPNNVDLRQGIILTDWSGDLVATSDRSTNSVGLFAMSAEGLETLGRIPSSFPEPYGLCMGISQAGSTYVFVTYKTGDLVQYRIAGPDAGVEVARAKLETQLEGCVHDDALGVLYVGEENKGVWRFEMDDGLLGRKSLVDSIGSGSGIKADVEGLALYKTEEGAGYLIASSQGNNSYALYDRAAPNRFIKRFRIADSETVDGAKETDGIEATSVPLGPNFPKGALIVQDGFNGDAAQNFKIVDWRAIDAILFATE